MQTSSLFIKVSRLVSLVAAALLVASCASKPTIETDYDRTVDFGQYKTYAFFNPMGIENPNYSSIYGSIFREAISKEMESRGYTTSDNPDLLINVSGRLQDKTKVTTTSDPYMSGGYYGYRRGAYGAWGGYGYGTQTHVSQYTEGTVNVDMVDRSQKRMVWEGVAVGRVNEKRTNEETRTNIHAGIKEMFAGYPFRAGQ
ncbi:MAG: DUF4136 domain-containing protein [Xanthomonadales bacterium]|nr:DUF4136 domain-containing protein [Xanthomonadales bacterium]